MVILIADACAHVANTAFLAAAVMNKLIAGCVFLFAVLIYKTLDKGLVGLGKGLQAQIEKQNRQGASAAAEGLQQQKEQEAVVSALTAEQELIAEAELEARTAPRYGGKTSAKKRKN